MLDVVWITLPVFAAVAMGYAAGYFRFFPADAEKIFTHFVFYLALPIYLFKTMALVPSQALGGGVSFIFCFAISLALTAFISYIIARAFFQQRRGEAVFSLMAASYTNAAFVGIPIMVIVFGNPAPVMMVVVFQLTCVMTSILVALDIYAQKKEETSKWGVTIPKTIIKNPIVLAVILGVLWRFWVPDLPEGVLRFCDLFGDAAIPLALFSLGLSLQQTAQVSLSPQHDKLVWVLSAMKIVVHPMIATLLGMYLFDLEDHWQKALILSAAMPTAVNHFVVAQKYGFFAARAGRVVFLTSIGSLCVITALLIYWQ